MNQIKFIQLGFGPIGQQIVRYAHERKNLKLDAVVDIDTEKIGKDAGDIANIGKTGVIIESDLEDVLKKSDADIVVISTLSGFKKIGNQISVCVKYGKNVVSTCEELLYPWINDEILAQNLDKLAKENGVSILGTGVNPGLLMDLLPSVLTAACKSVDRIVVKRYQDASKRRLPFQKKIGAGLDLETFNKLRDQKVIRHVGFAESINLIASGLGIKLDKTTETVEPVIADSEVSSDYIRVKKGDAKGVHQTAKGFVGEKEVITLELKAYLGNEQTEDTVEIYGEPNIKSSIKGGVNGDIATAAVVVNAMQRVVEASGGLKTMLDIAPVHYC